MKTINKADIPVVARIQWRKLLTELPPNKALEIPTKNSASDRASASNAACFLGIKIKTQVSNGKLYVWKV